MNQKTCERCGKLFNARSWNAGRYCTRACMILTPEQRFRAKVEKRSDGCWLWTGNKHRTTGYGTFGVRAGQTEGAHRFAYQLSVGPIPEGMQVCHRCDVRLCVNPDHLFLGTAADNQHDKVAKGRQLKGEQAPQAKLQESDIRAIRSAEGLQREIASVFGVSRAHVSEIRSGKAWKHV